MTRLIFLITIMLFVFSSGALSATESPATAKATFAVY